jgi:hypothetical protein
MAALTDARAHLAEAVTAAGLECLPYPPDSVTPPIAFVDTITVDFEAGAGWSFCMTGMATATITSCAQRNDKAGATKGLENLVNPAVAALYGIDGVRVSAVQSGVADIGGTELPAVVYTVQFAING